MYRTRQTCGEPATMPIHLVQNRIEHLHNLGITNSMIAHAAELDMQTISHIERRNTDHVRIEIAAKIWKIDHHPHPKQKLVPAIGARRRIRALNAIGWPTTILAQRLGHPDRLVLNDSLRRDHITYKTWADCRDLYNELSGTQGPSIDGGRRARTRGGYAPPLAWYDRDIDHPHTKPRRTVDPRDKSA
jgi:hypothetical protein